MQSRGALACTCCGCLFLRGYRVLFLLTSLTWPSHFFPCDFRDPTRLDNFSKGRQRHFP
ncbi:hypothetical protein BO79DRAFT_56230 [Aspergillus costaricaensis CBS 115574]|uniref:Uncharacterized protein n=1 Tax=Aspergillus costaricaensis CBS 115574 TaxID=1448317 RepID=A0ACD1IQ57_9EURO|nr:hypothetical protein BO79DRAFT_56230 [Aspergillus costaricaensis CBS 115574]RAK92772.1 hypothetical protein BO79DRAFT_56230 [Aspergillus costaricaensis CBS 115574]